MVKMYLLFHLKGEGTEFKLADIFKKSLEQKISSVEPTGPNFLLKRK